MKCQENAHFRYTTCFLLGNRPSPNGDRVLGGRPARQGEFPHIVSIQNRNGGKFCGGTILDGSWVLTAAHCLPGESADNLKVVGGVVDLRTFPPERQDINVQSFCMHKDYRDTTSGYDIALLRLEQPIQPSRYVRSGRIRYQAFSNLEGTPGVIAGWGRVGGARTSEMYTATVDYYNMAECRKNYQENQPPGTALCAGSGPYGGKDVCPGDSGGPISCTDGQTKYDTCGLVSSGTSCTEEQDQFRGGVYTNVASFARWINDAKYATADDNPNLCRFS